MIYYKNKKGELRQLTFDDNLVDITFVQEQEVARQALHRETRDQPIGAILAVVK